MRMANAIVLMTASAALWGCQMSPRGGGMSHDESFRIVVPLMETKVQQGETRAVEVSLNRGEYFKQDVKLEVRTSKGIGVEPERAHVKASEKPDVQLRITAPKDAAIGGYRVYVKATPKNGEPTSADFEVKVVAPG